MSNIPKQNAAITARLCAGELRAPVRIPGALELPRSILDDGLAAAPPTLRYGGHTSTRRIQSPRAIAERRYPSGFQPCLHS